MVMRNRNEGNDTRHWWDDLPPHVRNRFHQPIAHEEPPATATAEPPMTPSRSELLLDLSRLGLLFVVIALGNILFLLVALSFVNS